MARKSRIKPRFILRSVEDSVPPLDQRLIRAYFSTIYRIAWQGQTPIDLILGMPFPDPAISLDLSELSPFALITAWNPHSVQLADQENESRGLALKKELEIECTAVFPSVHISSDGSWPVEKGCCALGIKPGRAAAIGMKYGQNAIIWWDGDIPELWWLP